MAVDNLKRIINGHFLAVRPVDHLRAQALNWAQASFTWSCRPQTNAKAERYHPMAPPTSTSSGVTAPAIHLAHLAPGGSVLVSAGRFHGPGRMPATPVRRACGVILPTYRGPPGQ